MWSQVIEFLQKWDTQKTRKVVRKDYQELSLIGT